MGVKLEKIATEANSTDFVSSICPEKGKKSPEESHQGFFKFIPFIRLFILFLT